MSDLARTPADLRPMPKADFLHTHDLSRRYRVRPSTVTAWRNRGDGPPFIIIGRKAFYPLSEVIAWEQSVLRGGRARPDSDPQR